MIFCYKTWNLLKKNSIKNIEKNSFREKNFGQKLKFLAHSGGWIVPKIIFWPIFSHLVSSR
jgi:hypothetical protein